MVYEPQEDSFLLKEFVKRHAKGKVLDMGTGSGIQAVEAAHSKKTTKVYGVDIDPEAIAYCVQNNNKGKHTKINWMLSDLFSAFGKKFHHYFDTIIFNAPYLPQDHKQREIALEGGKQGHETIERFLSQVNKYIKPNGKLLLVFSSLTPHIPQLLQQNMLEGKLLGKKHMFFEDIYVYLIKRNETINKLEKKGLCDIKFFAKGKRGLVFTANKGKIAIKIKRPDSQAINSIVKEAKMLKELNKHGIGPKYLFSSNKYLVYKFVKGKYLKDCIDKQDIRKICKKILEQCFELDLLHIDKQEMTRPYKHAIIDGNKVTLIDFERARKTNEAHNVTQFCTFIMNQVDKNKDKWIKLSREYQKEKSDKNIEKMMKELTP